MIKCFNFIAFLSIIMLHEHVQGRPQDISEAAVLALAQAKDTFDNGAAASDKKEFEFFGAKVKNEMDIGFGDAARSKRSNHHSKEERNFKRTKRFVNVEDFIENIINSHEKLIVKRAAEDTSIVIDNSDSSDYASSYSEYSSEESEEYERRKRFANFYQFAEDMKKLYFLKN